MPFQPNIYRNVPKKIFAGIKGLWLTMEEQPGKTHVFQIQREGCLLMRLGHVLPFYLPFVK